MNKLHLNILIVLILVALGAGWWLINQKANPDRTPASEATGVPQFIADSFETKFSKRDIEWGELVSGGPGKDGIPSIDDPEFVSIKQARNYPDGMFGILLELNGEKRYYPFNVLAWHEIVNDQVGEQLVAVTFCPLCGSAIVFDRTVEGQTLEFGVSGLLRESNLVMYDRQTESFWQQSTGKGLVGEFAGRQLEFLSTQRLTWGQLKQNHSGAKVLSSDTGYSRNYDRTPYGNYSDSEQLLFDVSVSDERFPAKEIMVVVSFQGKSVAIPNQKLRKAGQTEITVDGETIQLQVEEGLIKAIHQGETLPTYFEMWFSWATQHQDDGVVKTLD